MRIAMTYGAYTAVLLTGPKILMHVAVGLEADDTILAKKGDGTISTAEEDEIHREIDQRVETARSAYIDCVNYLIDNNIMARGSKGIVDRIRKMGN
jgi:hypothetical protein